MTWRELAILLGHRMANHAFCEDHPLAEARTEDCPYCHDRQAYLLFVAKTRQTHT